MAFVFVLVRVDAVDARDWTACEEGDAIGRAVGLDADADDEGRGTDDEAEEREEREEEEEEGAVGEERDVEEGVKMRERDGVAKEGVTMV